jgi:hypothetical protein
MQNVRTSQALLDPLNLQDLKVKEMNKFLYTKVRNRSEIDIEVIELFLCCVHGRDEAPYRPSITHEGPEGLRQGVL